MVDVVRCLRNLDIFKDHSERDLKKIASYLEALSLAPKQMVFMKGQPIKYIYLLISGSVKIQETSHSNETIIYNFLGRGEFLGVAMAGLSEPRYPTSAQCNESCLLLRAPLHTFFGTLMQIPEVRATVNQQISERFLEFQNDICHSHCMASFRIANFLLRLLDRQKTSVGGYIQIPLSRLDIAQRVGVQSETAIRTISYWTKAGIVRTDEKHMEILNRQALEDIRRDRTSKKAPGGAPAHIDHDESR